ncbi:MAG: hypothetical protein COX65_07705 [Elusimicrobia bacterium CG_4_10_14_0_2_um_filter_56_8]|nr:MAG: hypothetical protein COX65_07705 [Elusimicrobia bacterium CG_4_10_14_0_2_um_filter_56_8]
MIIDYAGFTRASNLVHLLQGSALLLLGSAEAYSLKNNGKKYMLAVSLLVAVLGAAMFVAVLALPGGWDFSRLAQALQARRGFYLFISFACLYGAAGLSRFMHELSDRGGSGWMALFLALLASSGALYFLMAWRVNEEAWRQVLAWHSAIGLTLLLAVAAKSAELFLKRRALQAAWAALLIFAGLQLAAYKEAPGSFAPRLVTIESSPAATPARPKP